MRVSCPACAATYDVPQARIGTGRKLRCARCKEDWFATPPAVAAEPGVVARDEAPPSAPPVAAVPSPLPEATPAASVPPVMPGPDGPAADSIAAGASASADTAPAGTAPVGTASADTPPASSAQGDRAPEDGPPQPTTRAAERRPASDRAAGGSGTLMLAWAGTLVVMLGIAAALVLYRVQIVAAWPPSERLYVALGLLPG